MIDQYDIVEFVYVGRRRGEIYLWKVIKWIILAQAWAGRYVKFVCRNQSEKEVVWCYIDPIHQWGGSSLMYQIVLSVLRRMMFTIPLLVSVKAILRLRSWLRFYPLSANLIESPQSSARIHWKWLRKYCRILWLMHYSSSSEWWWRHSCEQRFSWTLCRWLWWRLILLCGIIGMSGMSIFWHADSHLINFRMYL